MIYRPTAFEQIEDALTDLCVATGEPWQWETDRDGDDAVGCAVMTMKWRDFVTFRDGDTPLADVNSGEPYGADFKLMHDRVHRDAAIEAALE